MKTNTEDLIARLSADGAPVSRLASPWVRALTWLAIAVPYAAAVVWYHGVAPGVGPASAGALIIAEQSAALATAVAAAVAAFARTVPGYDRRILLLPVVPLVLWLATVSGGCMEDWLRHGSSGLSLRTDWDCLRPAIALGLVPLAAMIVMLRRGAPIRPHVSVLLGALATAALANAALRLFHGEDAAIIVLVWHMGVAAVIVAFASLIGRLVLNWRQLSTVARG